MNIIRAKKERMIKESSKQKKNHMEMRENMVW